MKYLIIHINTLDKIKAFLGYLIIMAEKIKLNVILLYHIEKNDEGFLSADDVKKISKQNPDNLDLLNEEKGRAEQNIQFMLSDLESELNVTVPVKYFFKRGDIKESFLPYKKELNQSLVAIPNTIELNKEEKYIKQVTEQDVPILVVPLSVNPELFGKDAHDPFFVDPIQDYFEHK